MATVPSSLITSIQVDFGSSGSQGSLSLSMFNSYVGMEWTAIKLVDSVKTGVLDLFCDVGTIEFYKDSSESITDAIELVSNVERIDAPYGEAISFLWAVSSEGEIVFPTLKFNPVGKYYTVTPKSSGVLKRSSFDRPFKILRYKPKIVTAGLGAIFTYGVVAAVHGSAAAILQVEPIADGNDKALEAYRIVSEVLVNEEGEWEKPLGWPDTPSYEGGKTPVPDAGSGIIAERVHEICVITSKVTTAVRTYLVPFGKPYLGDSSYKPVKTIKEGALSSMSPDQRILASETISDRKKRDL